MMMRTEMAQSRSSSTENNSKYCSSPLTTTLMSASPTTRREACTALKSNEWFRWVFKWNKLLIKSWSISRSSHQEACKPKTALFSLVKCPLWKSKKNTPKIILETTTLNRADCPHLIQSSLATAMMWYRRGRWPSLIKFLLIRTITACWLKDSSSNSPATSQFSPQTRKLKAHEPSSFSANTLELRKPQQT